MVCIWCRWLLDGLLAFFCPILGPYYLCRYFALVVDRFLNHFGNKPIHYFLIIFSESITQNSKYWSSMSEKNCRQYLFIETQYLHSSFFDNLCINTDHICYYYQCTWGYLIHVTIYSPCTFTDRIGASSYTLPFNSLLRNTTNLSSSLSLVSGTKRYLILPC